MIPLNDNYDVNLVNFNMTSFAATTTTTHEFLSLVKIKNLAKHDLNLNFFKILVKAMTLVLAGKQTLYATDVVIA
jgi:hypothetical protein